MKILELELEEIDALQDLIRNEMNRARDNKHFLEGAQLNMLVDVDARLNALLKD